MGDRAQRGNRLTAAKGGRIGKFGGGRTNLLEELGRVEAEPSNPNRRAEISRVHGELNRGYAKGGRVGRPKKPSTHGKDVPTMAATGGRIGLKGGSKSKPWGTGPKPGTHDYLMQELHKRKGKAIGGPAASALKKAIGRITHEVPTGPHTDVRRRNLNPSFVDKSIESGRTKERKRKQKIMGMGWKNVAKRMVGQKEGGRIGLKKGGKSDKNWIQKATKGMVKTKPCTGKKFGSESCPPGSKRYNLAKTFKKMGRERKAKG